MWAADGTTRSWLALRCVNVTTPNDVTVSLRDHRSCVDAPTTAPQPTDQVRLEAVAPPIYQSVTRAQLLLSICLSRFTKMKWWNGRKLYQ